MPGDAPTNVSAAENLAARRRELAWLFLRLGCTSFGGPAVHMALMEDEVVRRRGWMTREKFVDLLGATNLIPGPNSTEMAIHIGWLVGGRAGFFIAGLCFILPAVLLVTAIAWAYVRWGTLPQVEGVLYGIKPVVVAVVAQALWRLGRTSVRTRFLAAVGIAATLASYFGWHELLVLFGAGVLVATIEGLRHRGKPGGMAAAAAWLGWPAIPLAQGAVALAGASPVTLEGIFLFFLKVGSVLFGTGYVLLAFLRADLVERWHWLTESQLLDAIAVGQVTPGPIFTTATFIGYVLAGVPGAALATIGIFLPAFVFVAISGPLVPRLRESRLAAAFLDGVNVAALALMAVTTWQLGRAAIVDYTTLALAGISALLLIRYQLNATWLILGGAAIGWMIS